MAQVRVFLSQSFAQIKILSPRLDTPWFSLKELLFCGIHVAFDMFEEVKLHLGLPNLEKFELKWLNVEPTPLPMMLPDLGGCEKLRTLVLCGDFQIPYTRQSSYRVRI